MDIKHPAPPALPSSWTIPQTVNMNDHGRKSTWTTQLSPYLRGLKIKNLMTSPKSPKSPRFPLSPKSPRFPLSPKSPRTPRLLDEDSSFRIIHTPDRPDRPISRRAIPNDEQCMEFLMSLQRQEEHKRGGVKTGLKMWPYPEEQDVEDRRYLRSVRVESVHLEEARLARTNSSGPAKVVEVGRSSTKSTMASRRSYHTRTPSVSDAGDIDEEPSCGPTMAVGDAPLSPPPTLSRSQSRLSFHTPKANTSRWSDDSIESLFSSRNIDSPCPQRVTVRSSSEALSPTVVGDESIGSYSPPLLTPVKDRPATPFTDPRLRATSEPMTPPPSDHIVHQMSISPEPVPRKYSWRSSKDTILNTGAPISRFQSWLPEARPEGEIEGDQQQEQQQQQQQQQQQAEPEVYGEWADYYFEDGNFWEDYSDGDEEGDETRVEEEEDADAVEKEEQDVSEDEEEKEEEKEEKAEKEENEGQKDRLRVDDEEVYPRYESFIKDYKNNVMNITVAKV
ncbi:hypothetical protein BDP81DRAFT_4280 [Colletotrichum phormii]|uniref:Uncharacterized protein n=1 Tax=Colletotrichum phormii TaxID=359342 RepID=A0AAJ0ELD4_9PEZI|nr:uncharacterized protein BDP81DRAFT_4280 [Colletotrichum phormii]KAK1655457.1 hypothetical protein BDP81DRAFT_4280 [Colletotrichum phormii]